MKNLSPIRALGKIACVFFLLLISQTVQAQLSQEDFESGIPATWASFGNAQAISNWQAVNGEGYLGSNAVKIDPALDNIGDGNTAEYFLATPQFPVPDNGIIQFYTKLGSSVDNGTHYEIRLSTAGQSDVNGYGVTLKTWTVSSLNIDPTAYELKTVQIPTSIASGLNVYIAFVAVNTQTGATPVATPWFVDNVEVVEGCTAVNPDNVLIDNIGPDQATMTWADPGSGDFEVVLVPSGDPIPATGTAVSGTSHIFSGLDPDTAYDAYIKSICANGTESAFVGPFTFTTQLLGLSCDSPIIIPDVFTNGEYELQDNLSNYSYPTGQTYTTQGSGCLDQGTNWLAGDKIFFSYTASQDGLITLSQSSPGYVMGTTENCFNANTSVLIYDGCTDVGVACLAALKTDSNNGDAQISNFVVSAGETYIIVMSSNLSPGAGICFDFTVNGSFCSAPAPSSFTIDDIQQQSVVLSWTNPGNFASSWEYVALPEGTGPPTAAGTATTTNTALEITGLTAGTAYDFYVRSDCGGSFGDWGAPFSFTTQCSTFTTPFEEDFTGTTNGELPDCWYAIDANNDGSTWKTQSEHATSPAFFNTAINDDYLVSPIIDLSGGQKRLVFTYQALGGDVHFEVLASSTGVGADNFNSVVLAEQTYTQTEWNQPAQLIVVLPTTMTGEVNFAWYISPDSPINATRIYIDNVVVEDMPACSDPIAPQLEGTTQTTASFSWTPGYQETQWETLVQDQGLPAPADTDSGTVTSDNPFTATGLAPGHLYDFYVRAYCNAQDQSQWIGPVSFHTACASYDTPFYESFDDTDPNTQKFCWQILDENGDGILFSMSPENAVVQTPIFGSVPGFDDWLISPAINVDGIKKLSFKYRATASFFGAPRFGLQVLMSTTDTDPASFTEIIPTFTFTNSDYITKKVFIEANGPVYIAFRVPPDFDTSAGISNLNIDDVNIVDAPDCPKPTTLTVNNITTNSADFSWTEGYQETNWNIAVLPAGSPAPTSASDATASSTATNYSAQNLTPNFGYDAYVQADCGNGDASVWIGPASFSTLCLAVDTPFHETFNSDSQTENCWTVIDGNGDGNYWTDDIALFPYEGDQSAGMFTGSNGANDDWLITPGLNISPNQRLRFYYRAGSEFYIEDLQVLLSITGTEPADFTTELYNSTDLPDPIINNAEYKEMVINLPASVSGTIYIAFHVPQVASTAPYRGQSLYIDNVFLEDIPPCAAPSNLEATTIADTQVQLSWDSNGSETSWEIAALPEGSPAPGSSVDAQYLYTATTNPFTVTGLTPATGYDFYIRSVCDASTKSEWSGPTHLVTLCDLTNLCQYTVTLVSGGSFGVGGGIQVIQDEQVVQTLEFPTGPYGYVPDPEDYTVLLCTGVQFSLFWDSVGTAPGQYPDAQVILKDADGNVVWTSPMGIGTPRTTLYTGVSACGAVSCPQPTDLTINSAGQFSWTSAGSETQWEVAVQPVHNGTIPQSGTVVDQPSYTPTASDFVDPNAATYEYFVRALCSDTDQSYWSGPYVFVRNDDQANALELPVNPNLDCIDFGSAVSFTNANPSTGLSDTNTDVWFTFQATSPVQIIQINGYTGMFYVSSGDEPYPNITMALYKDDNGTLTEMKSTNSNVIVASYSSELTVGETYTLRLSLNAPATNTRLFHVCLTTPDDLCNMNAVNGDFEEPSLHYLSAIGSIITQWVVPGWRTDFIGSGKDQIFLWNGIAAIGFNPYSGGQCAQLISDSSDPSSPPGYTYDENDPHGLYKDFDSSEITVFDYSFAYQARNYTENTVQLFAGPPGGPYTLVTELDGTVGNWQLANGSYDVPAGQDETRFMFTQKNYGIGMMIDAVNFTANNDILTEPGTVPCDESSVAVSANGVGTWIADPSNPSSTSFDDASASTTTITGLSAPGTYTFTWQTRYCEHQISFDYDGVAAVPAVVSPVDYCEGETATALTAPDMAGYTLLWFTSQTGTGTATAPTPDTSTPGTTSYYVAYANSDGCHGSLAEIVVNVNELTAPVLAFSYDDTCTNAVDNPMPVLDGTFTTGGTFSSTGVGVDPVTGEIDLSTATAGTYDVTYTVAVDYTTCTDAGTFTTQIVIDQGQDAVTDFSYPADVCVLEGTVAPILPGDFTTGGTFSSANLTVDPSTGTIDLAAATAGTYTVTYDLPADPANCIPAGSFSADITLVDANAPETTFSYPSEVCLLNPSVAPQLANGFTTGGVFSSTGLTVDATTGVIDLTNATAGDYTVTYTVDENLNDCMAAGTYTADVHIIAADTPNVEFTYPAEVCLLNTSVSPQLPNGFAQGGVFSSPDLAIDPDNGTIDLTNAAPGTHSVTYTIAEDDATCTAAGSKTLTINLIEVTNPVTSFSYPASEFCLGSTNVFPSLDNGFATGGIFSSDSGLAIDPNTGEINFANSAPGEYTVTYDVEADETLCESSSSSSFLITVYGDASLTIGEDCVDGERILIANANITGYSPDNMVYVWKDASGQVLDQSSDTFNVNTYFENHSEAIFPMEFSVEVAYGDCSGIASHVVGNNRCDFVPRGISPNGDGLNDSFDLSDLNVVSIKIFNRYGTHVFEQDGGYTDQWHGQSNNGNDLPDGTYYYSLRKQNGSHLVGWVYINRQH